MTKIKLNKNNIINHFILNKLLILRFKYRKNKKGIKALIFFEGLLFKVHILKHYIY